MNAAVLVCLEIQLWNFREFWSSFTLIRTLAYSLCTKPWEFTGREFESDYCALLPPLAPLGVHEFEWLSAVLCSSGGASPQSADSCCGGWHGRRELCMMWASNISSSRSYRGTMFFIFMQWRWSIPLLLHIIKENHQKTKFIKDGRRIRSISIFTGERRWFGAACFYLTWRMCESSMSRWARRVYCWRKVRPVLAMAHTSASVTVSRRRSSLVRLCSSSLPSEELRHMSGNAHKHRNVLNKQPIHCDLKKYSPFWVQLIFVTWQKWGCFLFFSISFLFSKLLFFSKSRNLQAEWIDKSFEQLYW